MLSSISPLGERARGNRWGLTASAYVAGSVAAAVALGAALGLAGSWILPRNAPRLLLLGGSALTAGIVDLALPGTVPTGRRQVDEDWLARYRGWVYGLGFGAQLGVGVATIVTTAILYACFAAAVLTASPVAGAVVVGAFGLARTAPLAAVSRVATAADLRSVLRRLSSWAARARAAAAVVSVGIGVACLSITVARP